MSYAYIKHGFLAGIYEPWVAFEGTEWGDAVRPLHRAYESNHWEDGDLDQMEALLRRTLEDASEWLFEDYPDECLGARLEYPKLAEYWADQAQSFKQSDAFAEAVSMVPPWMLPPDEQEQLRARISNLQGELEKIEKDAEERRKLIAQLREDLGAPVEEDKT